MKKCNQCLIEKELSDFPKVGKKCKLCKIEYRKKYRELNKDKLIEKSKSYYLENKESILDNSKRHYSLNKNGYYKEYRDNNKDIISKNHNSYVENNKEKLKEYSKEYYIKNKDKIVEYSKEYYENNKDKIADYNKTKAKKSRTDYDKRYREKNKEAVKNSKMIWRLNNKGYDNKYAKSRASHDKLFKITRNIRCLIKLSIKQYLVTGHKKSKTTDILGCSFEEFKMHLESKFESWMTWENHGLYNGELNYGWDMDHIIPVSSAHTLDDIIKLNHYSNFQPLCSKINRNIKRAN